MLKMIRSELLDDLMSRHQYEIKTFPIHYTDQMCVKEISESGDQNLIIYVAFMKGVIPILTIAGHKAFVVDLSKKEPSKFQQLSPNPSYSNIDPIEKHLRDQRDSL